MRNIYFWPAGKVIKLKERDVALSTSLFMCHLTSFSPHFIVHVSTQFCQSTLHWSCFISFPSVHTSLIIFHFYFFQSTVHLTHFTYHSPFHSYLPYLFTFILHGCSTILSASLSRQSHLWKLTTCLSVFR